MDGKNMDKMAGTSNKRFWELDFLRGLCVLLMVIDHFFFSASDIMPLVVWPWCGTEFWVGLEKLAVAYWFNNARSIAHYVIVSLFMLICGISCTLSHSNLKRGLKAVAVALAITLVTYLVSAVFQMEGLTIVFGVIHMLAVSMLIYWALSLVGELIKKIGKDKKYGIVSDWAGRLFPALVGLVFLIVFFAVPWGHFGKLTFNDEWGRTFEFTDLISDVDVKRQGLRNFVSVFVWIQQGGIISSDYFPLLPYGCMVLIGSGIGELLYKTRAKNYLRPLDGKWNKPLSFVGRHAMLFYVLHQVVIIAFFFAAGLVFYLK